MRFEGEYRVAGADHLTVAEMHTVKFPDRDATWARLSLGQGSDQHGREG
jgi:hypothetical protein